LKTTEGEIGTSTDGKNRVQDWFEESFRGDLKRVARWITAKRYPILVVCLWTAVFSMTIVGEYYFLYETNPYLRDPYYRLAYAPTSSIWIPKLYLIDYVIIFAASLVAGFAISDVETTLFGFLASAVLSTVVSVIYTAYYIWYVLDFGSVLGLQFLTTIIWAAFLNVFRMIFPMAILITFFGGIFGSVIRGFIQPSAQE
jgi:hypothetical protein